MIDPFQYGLIVYQMEFTNTRLPCTWNIEQNCTQTLPERSFDRPVARTLATSNEYYCGEKENFFHIILQENGNLTFPCLS